MKTLLAKKLVEKGAIRQHTEFEALYYTHGLSCLATSRLVGRFRITSAKLSKEHDKVVFEAMTGEGKESYRFTNDQIITLDGMSPDKIASIYNLNANGEDLRTGKRRGRRPKNNSEVVVSVDNTVNMDAHE